MKDQFANYVVQKLLETCDDQQLEIILNRIKVHLNALKKYTYGKHIVARVEKLVAAGGTNSLPPPLSFLFCVLYCGAVKLFAISSFFLQFFFVTKFSISCRKEDWHSICVFGSDGIGNKLLYI